MKKLFEKTYISEPLCSANLSLQNRNKKQKDNNIYNKPNKTKQSKQTNNHLKLEYFFFPVNLLTVKAEDVLVSLSDYDIYMCKQKASNSIQWAFSHGLCCVIFACKDLGRRFHKSFHACTFFFINGHERTCTNCTL